LLHRFTDTKRFRAWLIRYDVEGIGDQRF